VSYAGIVLYILPKTTNIIKVMSKCKIYITNKNIFELKF